MKEGKVTGQKGEVVAGKKTEDERRYDVFVCGWESSLTLAHYQTTDRSVPPTSTSAFLSLASLTTTMARVAKNSNASPAGDAVAKGKSASDGE